MHKFLGLSVLLCVFSMGLRAQTSGSLTGEILDQSKASIGSAKVTAINAATGQKREASSDAGGRFTIPDVSCRNVHGNGRTEGLSTGVGAERIGGRRSTGDGKLYADHREGNPSGGGDRRGNTPRADTGGDVY